MINKPPPFTDLNIRIPIIIPIKGRGFIHHGSGLGRNVQETNRLGRVLDFRVARRKPRVLNVHGHSLAGRGIWVVEPCKVILQPGPFKMTVCLSSF